MESSNSPWSKRTKLDILVENYNEVWRKYTDQITTISELKDKIQSLLKVKESLEIDIKVRE